MSLTIEGVSEVPRGDLVDYSNKFVHNYPIVIHCTMSKVSIEKDPENVFFKAQS